MSDTLFELSCNQTIIPTVGTYSSVDNNTPVYELVDSDYYLKNTSSHGYYYFNVINTASRMLVSFDCVFNSKSGFNWIFLFENTQGQNWWGIGSYYSALELMGTSTSAQTLKTNIVDGTKLHIDIQIEHSTLANVVTILIDNTEVLNINLPSTYELSNFELLGNTGNYTSNCYIKDLSIGTYGKDYINKSGLAEIWANTKNYIAAQLLGKSNTGHTHVKNDITDFPTIPTVNNATLTIQKNGTNVATFTSNSNTDVTANITVPTKVSELTNDSCIPLSGTNAITGTRFFKSTSDNQLQICSGTSTITGGCLVMYGAEFSSTEFAGAFRLRARTTTNYDLIGYANGTLTWSGQSIQTVSDQRLKQQITQIDDKLLDAWGDVDLVQFKYNDAVNEKGDKARLHTGYVVQQIDEACQKHGVDVSAYGLYCHEEYPEETEEVEVEQADGIKTKETRVICETSEHYSLRYTEVYAVECMYLRRCIAKLTARIEELEKGNNIK